MPFAVYIDECTLPQSVDKFA